MEFRLTATLYREEKFQPERGFELGIADVAGIVTLEARPEVSSFSLQIDLDEN